MPLDQHDPFNDQGQLSLDELRRIAEQAASGAGGLSTGGSAYLIDHGLGRVVVPQIGQADVEAIIEEDYLLNVEGVAGDVLVEDALVVRFGEDFTVSEVVGEDQVTALVEVDWDQWPGFTVQYGAPLYAYLSPAPTEVTGVKTLRIDNTQASLKLNRNADGSNVALDDGVAILSIDAASSSIPGVVTVVGQGFKGPKTFNNGAICKINGGFSETISCDVQEGPLVVRRTPSTGTSTTHKIALCNPVTHTTTGAGTMAADSYTATGEWHLGMTSEGLCFFTPNASGEMPGVNNQPGVMFGSNTGAGLYTFCGTSPTIRIRTGGTDYDGDTGTYLGMEFRGGVMVDGSGATAGTVTSVALSGGTTGLSVSGSPVTTSGTITLSGTLALANGGTGASLSDPGADRIYFWDDSAGATDWLTLGSSLSISTTTLGVATAGITSAMLRDSAAVSVIGRSANSSGVPADIAAAANGTFLGRRSDALGFFRPNADEFDIIGAVKRSTAHQSVAKDTATVLLTGSTTMDLDTDSFTSGATSGYLKIPTGLGGWYCCGYSVVWESVSSDGNCFGQLYDSDGNSYGTNRQDFNSVTAFNAACVGSALIYLAEGKEIAVRGFQASGGALDALTSSRQSVVLWIFKVGDE